MCTVFWAGATTVCFSPQINADCADFGFAMCIYCRCRSLCCMIAADFQDRRRSGFSQIGLTRCLYVLGVLGWLTRPLFVFLPQICADYADYYMQRLGVSLTLVALHDCRRFSGPQAVWIYADWANALFVCALVCSRAVINGEIICGNRVSVRQCERAVIVNPVYLINLRESA